ncbi:MAG TPA: S41 family peptidase, partial [Polyangia bacterium]|nr:S41 family peptidase [Polyangia bacterium]
FFGPPEVCGPTATSAFGFLAHVDAVIFDLRDNGGGDPSMVAFMASHLFAGRTRLNDIYERKENKTTEQWTNPAVPGNKLVDKPVFVLTSKRTFSGAEDFSYALKNLKRATIIGETTGGGAHPTRPVRLDDHFLLGVPFARSVSTITKTDWEGTGVEPDVKVPADEALNVATKMAGEQLAKKRPRP